MDRSIMLLLKHIILVTKRKWYWKNANTFWKSAESPHSTLNRWSRLASKQAVKVNRQFFLKQKEDIKWQVLNIPQGILISRRNTASREHSKIHRRQESLHIFIHPSSSHEFQREQGRTAGRAWREEREGCNDTIILESQRRKKVIENKNNSFPWHA